MASHPRRTTLRVDGDGVRIVADRGVRTVARILGWAAAFVAVATVVALLAIRLTTAEVGDHARVAAVTPSPASPATVPPRVAGTSIDPAPAPRAASTAPHAPVTAVARRKPGDAPAAETPPPQIGARDVILALRAAGEHAGIAAFGVPGTDPPKTGIIVPDDFVLPPGYLRHYQTTDEGEALPPVLMVHPDYELVDAEGRPVPLPESRIVPPELAPPGLPIQMLQVPAAAGGAGTRP